MSNLHNRRRAGFTLVEIVAALGAFSIAFLSGFAAIGALMIRQDINYRCTVASSAAMLFLKQNKLKGYEDYSWDDPDSDPKNTPNAAIPIGTARQIKALSLSEIPRKSGFFEFECRFMNTPPSEGVVAVNDGTGPKNAKYPKDVTPDSDPAVLPNFLDDEPDKGAWAVPIGTKFRGYPVSILGLESPDFPGLAKTVDTKDSTSGAILPFAKIYTFKPTSTARIQSDLTSDPINLIEYRAVLWTKTRKESSADPAAHKDKLIFWYGAPEEIEAGRPTTLDYLGAYEYGN